MNRRYRQLFLLLGALALPSLVIGWLGWQVVSQQRVLDQEQADKVRRQTTAEIGAELVARLDSIKLRQIAAPTSADGFADSSVMLVAWNENGRLILPWESVAPDAALFQRAIDDKEFRDKVDGARKAAFANQSFDEASRVLRDLTQEAGRSLLQRAFARIRLAQVLLRWEGHKAEAYDVYVDLLKTDSSVVDEYGNLLWQTYAAIPLIEAHARESDILARVDEDVNALPALARWSKPLADTLARLRASSDPAVREGARASSERLALRLERLTALQALPQVAALQAAFPSLGVRVDNWWTIGPDIWFVGMGPPIESRALVLAVRAEDVRSAVEAARSARGMATPFRFAEAGSPGEPLGENLPGLRAVLTRGPETSSGAAAPNRQRMFYVLSLSLVIGLSFVGGYLLWRDTRRESRLAELRSQFVSSVSHELKTPLTSIRMFAESLQMKDSAANRRHAEYLDIIVSESERLTRLLNNVLEFSRIERGEKHYHMQTAALADSVQAAARAMRFPLTERQFDFQVDISPDVPPMPIDGDAIEQAVLNLLSNAMKYSGLNRHIELRLLRQNGHARIEVADRGLGIAPADQKHIFEKFYRAPTPESRAISGTGLGLSLVAHIAEAHGGQVEVSSTLGEGSTFSICLPLDAAEGGANS
jgi:signal transduction histidine kinase